MPPIGRTCRECKKESRKLVCNKCSLKKARAKKDPVTICFYNFKQVCRENNFVESVLWNKSDVEKLIEDLEIPKELQDIQENLRFRIVRIDKEKLFLPNNSKVKIIGLP